MTNLRWEDISNPNGTYEHRSFTGSIIYDGEFYMMYGWSDITGESISQIMKVDLSVPSFEWKLVEIPTIVSDAAIFPRDSYSYACVDNKFYIFAGYTPDGNLNDLVYVDLSSDPVSYKSLSNLYKGPSARSYHSMQVVQGKVYIFGGDYKRNKLNEL